MENASKALLIAAAVLIVILLIAFGMSVFRSAGDTSGEATAVGNQLTEQTGIAKNVVVDSINSIKVPGQK